MRMRPLAIALLLGLGGPLAAQDAAPPPGAPAPAEPTTPAVTVRQSLDPASGAVIGQHVALRVDVLFRDDMPRPPRVSLPEVPGVQVLRFETQATTLRETIGGANYVGQRFEFALYARRGGTFSVPPASVSLLDRQGDPAGTASGQPVSLEVRVPPGVDASGPVVATRELTLSEQWAPEPKGAFKAGDAIVRTITRTAEDVPGLALRDLAFPTLEGARTYVDPPDITDQSNRGVVTGRRTDRVTYLFERGGRFELPAVEQPWWDLGPGTLRTARASGAVIEVAAPAPTAVAAPDGWMPLAAWVAAGLVLLALVALAVRRHQLGQRASKAHVEQDAFGALRRACAAADASAVYSAFARWRSLLDPARGRAAATLLPPLEAALFAAPPLPWNADRSQALLARAESLRRVHPVAITREDLPPLNP